MDANEIAATFEQVVDKKLNDMEAKMSNKTRVVDEIKAAPRRNLESYDLHKGKGAKAAQFLRTAALSKRSNVTLGEAAKSLRADSVTKALEAYDAGAGGFLVPEPVSDEIIELLRPQAVVMASGPRVMEMPAGNFSMNLQSAASTAYYIGECQPVAPSNPSFARQKLVAKKLQVLVPVCNDFLRYTESNVDQFVRDEMLASLADKMDQAFIRGDGTQDNPKGLRYMAKPANVFARTLDGGNVTIETVIADLNNAMTLLRLGNIPMLRPAWFMSPRTFGYLMSLTNGNAMVQFPSLQESSPTLYGIPVFQTTNLPVNLGGGGDESEIILGDMSQIVVGQAVQLEINSSPDASYLSGGVHHHGLQSDFTLISAIMAHDIMDLRQGASIAVITTVDWF